MKHFGTRAKLVAVLFAVTTMLGCGALDAGTPAAQTSNGLLPSSAIVDFGDVPVGTTEVRTNTIVNTSKTPVIVTHAQIDHTDFKITGTALPLTLEPGQRTTLQLAYSPQSGGSSQSRVVLASNVTRFSAAFTLRGTAIMAGRIKLNPTSMSFGNVQIGKTQTQSATLTNTGKTPVNITRATISGTGFALSGLTLPLRLQGGQSATVGVSFNPATAGPSSGTIALVATISLTLPKRPTPFGGQSVQTVALRTLSTTLTAPVTGTGMGAGKLSVSPESLALGSVRIGASQAKSATLINSGTSDLVVRQVTVSGKGFRMSGITFPMTLAAGQHKSFTVTFAPQAAGSSVGTIAVVTDASDAPVDVPVSGVATGAGALISNPSSLSFTSVQSGKAQTLSAAITNTGGSNVTVSQASVSGSGFTIGGLSLPMTLAAGQSASFNVTFNPKSGTSTGSVSFASDATNSSLTVPLTASVATAGTLSSSPSTLAFGSVQANTPKTVSAKLTNTGGSDVTVSQASVSGSGFSIGGLSLPMTLAAGQSASFNVTFNPKSGTSTGSVSFASDATNSSLTVPLTASVATAGTLSSSPSTLAFGSVQANTPKTVSAKLTNTGGSDVTVSQASVSGSGFSIGGLSLPMTLAAGQSASFNVTFNPKSGTSTGSVSFASDATNGSLTVPLTANSATAGTLSSSPSALGFGSVQANTPKTVSEKLTNTGGSSLTITQANISGSGFSLSGLSLPLSLDPGESATFNVKFMAQSAAAASGSLAISSNASNSVLSIPLSASAAAAGVLSTSDSSLNFGSVQVNGSGSQSETLTNSGGANVTISQATASGTGFTTSGLNLPVTLAPGQSVTFAAKFAPTTGGNFTGSISVVSDASDSSLSITLAGTASVPGQLAVSPATLNFGNVSVGQTKSLTASLTATGSSITISGAGMSTSEFTVSGLSLPLTLAAGKSASFTVTFKPQASGAASASGSFSSNAANSSVVQALNGTGAAPPQHSVSLNWNASTSSVMGYNVYRGTISGGPYSQIANMNADTSFVDTSVQSGQTYFYVTRAVDGNGTESKNSNQTQAAIPTP